MNITEIWNISRIIKMAAGQKASKTSCEMFGKYSLKMF